MINTRGKRELAHTRLRTVCPCPNFAASPRRWRTARFNEPRDSCGEEAILALLGDGNSAESTTRWVDELARIDAPGLP
eukprot:CAMPEP_0195100740 /NCGR_PEP_ID=MMETSP0448-20130528/64704_1 /TAXON_ID=66468 /ORGANISM="Heterocapsa triquestra, Strain CCMP 448" /LENGTH=77 /DNA_ID=CAMNT_0040135949 /DNA_START=29 /DNA_END=259 /DNA_ORIENTATION=-